MERSCRFARPWSKQPTKSTDPRASEFLRLAASPMGNGQRFFCIGGSSAIQCTPWIFCLSRLLACRVFALVRRGRESVADAAHGFHVGASQSQLFPQALDMGVYRARVVLRARLPNVVEQHAARLDPAAAL